MAKIQLLSRPSLNYFLQRKSYAKIKIREKTVIIQNHPSPDLSNSMASMSKPAVT